MNLQIENSFSEIAEKARDRYEDAVKGARKGTEKAAGRLSKGKKPVRTISRFGVKLSGVSHRTVNKLWKRQTKLVEDQFDAVAEHLKAAADADNLKELVKTQIELVPDDTSRFADEAREQLKIVRGAGSEIRGILKETIDELKGRKPAAKKAPERGKKAATSKRSTPAAETPTATIQETGTGEIAA